MAEIELSRRGKALAGPVGHEREGRNGRGEKEREKNEETEGKKSATFYQPVNHASLLSGGEINNV